MESYPSYKDSGVEWIGEIPSHWDSKRLKHISNFQSGYSFKSEDFSIDEEIPVVRIGDVGDKIDFSKCVKLSKTFLDEHKDFIIKKNDITINNYEEDMKNLYLKMLLNDYRFILD